MISGNPGEDFFHNQDLLGVLVNCADFSPNQFLSLSSCTKTLREQCLSFEPFWSKFVGKHSQSLKGKQVFELYKNLTIAHLFEDEKRPFIEGLSLFHDVHEDRMLVVVKGEKIVINEPENNNNNNNKADDDDNDDSLPGFSYFSSPIRPQYKPSSFALASAVDGKIIKKFNESLINHVDVEFCRFLDYDFFFAVVVMPQESNTDRMRYVRNLEIQIFNINEEKMVDRYFNSLLRDLFFY